jgi:hypothetical protein
VQSFDSCVPAALLSGEPCHEAEWPSPRFAGWGRFYEGLDWKRQSFHRLRPVNGRVRAVMNDITQAHWARSLASPVLL